jgi:hypothetical protein
MKHSVKTLLVAILIVSVIYAVGSVLSLGQSLRLAFQAKSEAQQLADELRQRQVGAVSVRLPVIIDRLERAQSWQQPSFWIAAVPFVNNGYRVYRDALDAGLHLATSSQDFFNALTDGKRVESISDLDFSKAGLAYLTVQNEFEAALKEFVDVATAANDLSIPFLPESFQADIEQLQLASAQVTALIEPFLPFLKDLPTLLGKDEPQDFLILLQNPHELRPTGGFIGTYGRMTIDRGSVTQFFTDDIYRVDAKLVGKETDIAPEPFKLFANLNYWYVRDANWSPDFPTSAQDVLRLYTKATEEEGIDVVLAMTPRIVEEFLKITGPVTVDGITFTNENLIDALQYRVEQEFWRIGLKDEDRKIVINHLAQELRGRFFSLSTAEATAFAEAAKRTIAEKEILVYSANPAIQEQLLQAGWAGAIPDVKHDLVAVVDANIGALKTDRLVDRSFDYEVHKRPDGQYQATLRLTYKNNGHFDYRTTRYRTYTRVYVPIGSELFDVQGLMSGDRSQENVRAQVYAEFDKTVFAGFVSVEPGQQRTVTYQYLLPPWFAQKIDREARYDLTVMKQPGTSPIFTGVFAGDKPLRSFAPSTTPYGPVGTNSIRFSQPLTGDQTFQILFAQQL